MKIVVLCTVGCVLLSAAVFLTVWSALHEGETETHDTDVTHDITRMKERMKSLERGQENLRSGVRGVDKKLSGLTTAIARARSPETQQAVASASPATEKTSATETEESAAREIALDESLATLLDSEVNRGRKQQVWSELGKAGLLDDAVEFFQQRALENDQDPDAQADAGHAYIQKLLTVGDIEKGVLAMKADAAFDKALALDDHHWGARFSKAVSYSFHPPVFGFQPKAIEQFEILRAQQEEAAPEQNFAQTYVFLGNLYANQGRSTKAREIWNSGLERFPESGELRKKIAPAGE